jgi:hypothetical protein
MCWVSNNPAIFFEIAEQDIKTFKVLSIGQHGDLYSYFFYSTYPIGEIKPKVILYSEKSFCKYFIDRGYHSYDKSIECKYYYDCKEYCGIVKVGNLETYRTNGSLPSIFPTLCIVECTIPKGTKYCLNEKGEYVSEQIRVDKILKEY